MEEFLNAFADSLEIDESVPLSGETLLETLDEWDSLGKFSLLSLAYSRYDREIDAESLNRAQTLGDLWALVDREKQGR